MVVGRLLTTPHSCNSLRSCSVSLHDCYCIYAYECKQKADKACRPNRSLLCSTDLCVLQLQPLKLGSFSVNLLLGCIFALCSCSITCCSEIGIYSSRTRLLGCFSRPQLLFPGVLIPDNQRDIKTIEPDIRRQMQLFSPVFAGIQLSWSAKVLYLSQSARVCSRVVYHHEHLGMFPGPLITLLACNSHHGQRHSPQLHQS